MFVSAYTSTRSYPTVMCAWCGDPLIEIRVDEAKQHMRQHVYEDFQANLVSKQEVAEQQQKQLKHYLESLLDS